jgi:2-polyprenyl-6-methoxyphenol hydroxylase-like FAD-dependent oxidoreductase
MYNNLPDKSTIQTGKKVVSIVEHEQGVRLTLEDGSWEEGDIAIGCDGVHSIVRAAMWQIANRVSPGLITDPEKECKLPLRSCWRLLILG